VLSENIGFVVQGVLRSNIWDEMIIPIRTSYIDEAPNIRRLEGMMPNGGEM
jgi:hypothetical protein